MVVTMDPSQKARGPLSTEQLPFLRKATDAVSSYLHDSTSNLVNVLRPALMPHRLLGQHIEHPGNMRVAGEEKAWTKLAGAYKRVANKLTGLPSELKSPLPPIDSAVHLHPWEYVHKAPSGSGEQRIIVVCPTKWVVSYGTALSYSQFRQAMETEYASQAKQVQQFVISALLIGDLIRSVRGLDPLLGSLRLSLGEETAPELPTLTFTTISSLVSSALPADEVVVSTTQLTGVPRFTELIEPESVSQMVDPLRIDLERLIGQKKA